MGSLFIPMMTDADGIRSARAQFDGAGSGYGPPALLVIDLQAGFLPEDSLELASRISVAIETYEQVAYLRFLNPEGSMFRRHLDWHDVRPGSSAADLVLDPVPGAPVFEKTGYSGATAEVLAWLEKIRPGEVHLAGLDTEACVLATALGLFDAGFRPVVLASLCASGSGEAAHYAALDILRTTIGPGGVRTGFR
jgi:nicotinamidase-related amidase